MRVKKNEQGWPAVGQGASLHIKGTTTDRDHVHGARGCEAHAKAVTPQDAMIKRALL